MNKLIIPEEFEKVDIKKLQETLNNLNNDQKLYQSIPVTGVYDILTESALVNALNAFGKEVILLNYNEAKEKKKGDKQ